MELYIPNRESKAGNPLSAARRTAAAEGKRDSSWSSRLS